MSEPTELTAEERMERFVEALADGATLVIHPDTWAEFKAALNKPGGELRPLIGLAAWEIPVIPNRLMKPGDMMAFKPKWFDDAIPEFRAQYLCEPHKLKLPPGMYCRNCSHSAAMYYDRMVPNRRGEDVPCCSDKNCGCTAHMVETFTIREETSTHEH